MAFLKNMIVGSDAPDPVAANVINPFSTTQGQTTFGQSQDAYSQQQAFLQALQGQNGLANQSNVFAQQQALANQLQGVANGTGPNPVLNQFNQATGQNIAAQGALMAGQRGAGANVGLLARQIAQQGAATQQQATGQSATLQAQQQMAGYGALQSQQNALAGQANQMVGQQQQGVGALNQFAQGNQNLVNTAYGAQNSAAATNQASVNAANASQYAADNAIAASAVGGLASGFGASMVGKAAPAPIKAAHGGMIEQSNGPKSHVTHFFANKGAMSVAEGGLIPGKAPLKGDHPKNDVVPALLSPKEIVIPRSITLSPDAPAKAAEFVAQILARKKTKKV